MKDEFVMVPREWVEMAVKAGAGEVLVLSDIATLAGCLSQPRRGEPVAWIVTDMNGDSYFAYDKQTSSDKPLYTRADPIDPCDHSYANKAGCPECGEAFAIAEPSAPVEVDQDALVAAVCVLRSQGLGNLSAAVEEARAALERKP